MVAHLVDLREVIGEVSLQREVRSQLPSHVKQVDATVVGEQSIRKHLMGSRDGITGWSRWPSARAASRASIWHAREATPFEATPHRYFWGSSSLPVAAYGVAVDD